MATRTSSKRLSSAAVRRREKKPEVRPARRKGRRLVDVTSLLEQLIKNTTGMLTSLMAMDKRLDALAADRSAPQIAKGVTAAPTSEASLAIPKRANLAEIAEELSADLATCHAAVNLLLERFGIEIPPPPMSVVDVEGEVTLGVRFELATHSTASLRTKVARLRDEAF